MIDEKKLIEEFREKAKGYDKDCGYWSKRGEHGNELLCAGKCSGIVQAIKIAENQPKVGEWIPCSERLPEKTGYYLVQLSRKLPNEDYSDRVVVLYNGEDKEFMAYERLIVAWMPLPESYKKKGA